MGMKRPDRADIPLRKSNITVIIRRMSVLLAVVALLDIGILVWILTDAQKKSFYNYQEMFRSDIEEMDETLSNIDQIMMNELAYDTDLSTLYFAGEGNETLETVGIKRRLKNSIRNWTSESPFPVNYVFYIPSNGEVINNCNTSDEYNLWHAVGDELLADLKKDGISFGWEVREYGGKELLVDAFVMDGKIMAGYIEVHEIAKSLKEDVYGSNAYIAGEGLEGIQDFAECGIPESEVNRVSIIKNRIVLMEEARGLGNIYLVITSMEGYLKMLLQQGVFLVVLAAVVGVIIWYLLYINRTVVQPIANFNENMEQLKNDQMYTVNTHYQIQELGNASELMADMVDKIKKLKIDIYEKTLEQQKTRMDFLALQIEPHFFINCLNLIYSMAQMKDYASIKAGAKCTSDYLRYMFKNQNTRVRVQEEVQHIERYLEIQKFRYREGFEACIEVEEEVREMLIPPLILQTFVENSIKHTLTWDKKIQVIIRGYCLTEEGGGARIEIADTGEGFPEDILEKLQSGQDISEGENRIGVMNAIARFREFSGADGNIAFCNREGGGAQVTICLPKVQETAAAAGERKEQTDMEERG